MVMFRGRGGRGGGRGGAPPPHLMHGVPPMRLKPGRGMPRGSAAARRGGPPPPRPLMPRAAYGGPPRYLAPRPGPPMPYGLPAPYPSRGAGGPPYRGRGGPPRGRGGPPRGRGGPSRGGDDTSRGRGRGRGTVKGAKADKPAKASQPKEPKAKKPGKTEMERDEIVMKKPWVTPELREEIMKKHEMHALSRKTGDEKDFEAFKQQRNKVTSMLRAAKMEYIGLQDEQDVNKIMAEASLKQASKDSESSATAETKTEPKAAENGADTESTASTKIEPGENGAVAQQSNGVAETPVKVEPMAA